MAISLFAFLVCITGLGAEAYTHWKGKENQLTLERRHHKTALIVIAAEVGIITIIAAVAALIISGGLGAMANWANSGQGAEVVIGILFLLFLAVAIAGVAIAGIYISSAVVAVTLTVFSIIMCRKGYIIHTGYQIALAVCSLASGSLGFTVLESLLTVG